MEKQPIYSPPCPLFTFGNVTFWWIQVEYYFLALEYTLKKTFLWLNMHVYFNIDTVLSQIANIIAEGPQLQSQLHRSD